MQTFRNKNEIIMQVVNVMTTLTMEQTEQLKMTLEMALYNCKIVVEQNAVTEYVIDNNYVLKMFIASKTVSGRAKQTLNNYCWEIKKMFEFLQKNYKDITTDDIKIFMYHRKKKGNLSNISVNNIRLYLKSFFKFLTVEEYIDKDPMLKIEALKIETVVRTTLTSEDTELVRCNCTRERDLAIIDLLQSSGIRVGELVKLNKKDVDLNKKEMIVFGKGKKERQVFISGKAVVHLRNYLESRIDDNEALFVTVNRPYRRISIAGIRYMLKTVKEKNEKTKDIRLHPHAFRYTFGTDLINKGAPVEHVQVLLGHANPDTTLRCYAKLANDTVRQSHKKYID